MSQPTTDLVRTFFGEADSGRTAVELLSPGFTAEFTGLPPMDTHGYDQFEADVRAAFSGIRHEIHEVVAEGDRVAVRLTLRGTHTGDFMGVPASGEDIAVEGTAFLRVADNRITRLRGFLDQMGLLQQIRALPAPDPTG